MPAAECFFGVAETVDLRMRFAVSFVPSFGQNGLMALTGGVRPNEHCPYHRVGRYEILPSAGYFDTMCDIICVFHFFFVLLHRDCTDT